MRVLVFGAAGQLGRAVLSRFSAEAEVIGLTRAEADISDDIEIASAVGSARADLIINCAAYNAVDDAEDHAAEALAVNAFAVLAMARAARGCGAAFVHYGTDFVFGGDATRPYEEEDAPEPRSTYGLSKLLGEWFAADAGRYYVMRVESLFGGERAKSSVDRILDAILKGEATRVFVDRTVTPSYVDDVAHATARLLEVGAAPGLYHCVNTGLTTWKGLAEEAGRILGLSPELIPVQAAAVSMRAQRPLYCALSNEKLRLAGVDMPAWQDALARYIRRRCG